jgi:hypothetical protein
MARNRGGEAGFGGLGRGEMPENFGPDSLMGDCHWLLL